MKKNIPLFIIVLVLIVDQWLKIWVKTHMMLEQEFPVFGNFLFLHFEENKGMAFGFEVVGVWGKYFLSIVRIFAVIGIGWLLVRLVKSNADQSLIVIFSLLFAGAFGNIIDNAFYGLVFTDSFGQYASVVSWGEGYAPFLQGAVVDMFYLEIANFHLPEWVPLFSHRQIILFRPVFNVADLAIIFSISFLLFFRRNLLRKTLLI